MAPPEAKQKRINPIKLRQLQERCQALESEIQELEQSIAECETSLQNFVSAEETMRVTEALAGHRKDLESRVAEWSELSETLEANV